MTTTITKRADELKPGDVLPVKDGSVVVISVRDAICGYVEIVACGAGESYSELMPRTQREPANTRITVESPALTPAQQHAEELLDLVRKMAGVLKYYETLRASEFEAHRAKSVEKAHELLALIDPPQPPTLEEALEIMRGFDDLPRGDEYTRSLNAHMEKMKGLLDRARRAKIIP